MAVDGVVFRLHAGHVVHARSPAARPVGAVAPRVVQAEPLIISAEGGEYLVQAVHVAELVVIDNLAPRQDVRAGAGGVVPLEAIRPVRLDLAADEPVGVLLGVEIVQRALEGEETRAEAGEHHHEGGIPHKDVAVVGHVEVAAHEAASGLGRLDVADAYLPRLPIHLDFLLVPRPRGVGQDVLGFLEGARRDGLRVGRAEGVLRHERFFQVGVLVRQVIFRLFVRLRFPRQQAAGGYGGRARRQ